MQINMTFSNTTISSQLKYLSLAMTTCVVCLFANVSWSQDISDRPLSVGGNVAPNMVLTMDDSGSMGWAFITEAFEFDDYWRANHRSNSYNRLAYDPNTVYVPPLNADGSPLPDANFNNAIMGFYHPTANQITRNLNNNFAMPLEIYRVDKFLGDERFIGLFCTAEFCTSERAHYYEFDASNANCTTDEEDQAKDNDCYTKVVITEVDQQQNFANWYQYYSTRESAAKSALLRVLTEDNISGNIRVARQSINEYQSVRSGPKDSGVNYPGLLSENSERENLYDWIRDLEPAGGTPLRSAVVRAGEFFTQDQAYREDPSDPNSNILSCRANAHLLVSDGAWNGLNPAAPAQHDNVGANGTPYVLPDGKTYTPGEVGQIIYPEESTSRSVADYAFHYWATDLYGDSSDNKVSPYWPSRDIDPENPSVEEYWNPAADPATWQHMTTYSIGFGLSGTIPVPDAEVYSALIEGSFTDDGGNTVSAYNAFGTGTSVWPAPTNDETRSDDAYHAGINGRGGFYPASNPTALVGSLGEILNNINERDASASTVVADSGRISQDSLLYVARYNTDEWNGQLIAFDISDGSEFDPGSTTISGCNANSLGTLCGEVWDAGAINTEASLPHATRNIFTYDPNFNEGENPVGTGIEFRFASLNDDQKSLLSTVSTGGSNETLLCPVLDESHRQYNRCINNNRSCLSVLSDLPCEDLVSPTCYVPVQNNDYTRCINEGKRCGRVILEVTDCPVSGTTGAGNAEEVVNYLRGDSSNEEQNSGFFRTRNTLRLGPIFHSSPAYVGNGSDANGLQQFDFPDDLESASYSSFVSSIAGRTPVVYVGANDGMLHAYNAERSGGNELFSYVPNAVMSELNDLVDPEFTSNAYVDGPIKTQDAFIGGSWATILVGGLRSGAQAYYALDITDPDATGNANAAADLVLWEFSDKNDADMGFSTGAAQIVRANNGKWIVLVGNGHLSETADDYPGSGKAVLYALDAETGAIVAKIDVGQGNASNPNGLSTPTAILGDTDDLNVDFAYAGDLHGNMWRFDLTDANPSNWGATLLYTTDSGQPITGAPTVGSHPNGAVGNVIYFGTGRYLGENDLPDTNQQTLYAILDEYTCTNSATACISRSNLVQQSVASNFGTSASVTDNAIDWNTQDGWFFDLPTGSASSERVAGQPQLVGPSVVFLTIVPKLNPCDDGGFNNLYVLNRGNGGTTLTQLIDRNQDGMVDENDQRTNSAGEQEVVSIIRTSNDDPVTELKFFADIGEENQNGGCSEAVAAGINMTCFSNGSRSNRIRWRQLQ